MKPESSSAGLEKPREWFAPEELRNNATASLAAGSYLPRGWDPYEVWSVRIRGVQKRPEVGLPVVGNTIDSKIARRAIGPAELAGRSRRPFYPPIWPALVLVVILGVNRTLVGVFDVDLVTIIFGAMTPAARTVQIILGIAAVYCVVTTLLSGGRRVKN